MYRSALLIGGFLFAAFFVQGLPYWDCDYSINFAAIRGKSLFELIGQWISPVYSGVDNWGFLDRPAQFIVYRICYAIAGYNTWPYLLFKSACYAGLAVMVYVWALRLIPRTSKSRAAAAAAALFFLVAPGPVGSLVWLADFGPTAELAFLVLTFVIWRQVEATPIEWKSLSPLRDRVQRRWLYEWIAISFAVYLGYKTKADLKLIPLIFAAYILLLRAKQWKLFGIPIALMFVLAVPWSGNVFTKLPPFIPNAAPTNTGYSWVPANVEVVRQFLWSTDRYNFMSSWKVGTFALSGLLGPFLLVGILAFIVWWLLPFSAKNWKWAASPESRARIFVVIWFLAMLVGVSALPIINDFFRIRWGLLTLVPVSILLAWVFSLFVESWSRLPRWAIALGIALFAVQAGINLSRSVYHRKDMGEVTIAVDRVYAYVDKTYPADQLALFPGFLSYEYSFDAGPALRDRDTVTGLQDLVRRHTPDKTSVISWTPAVWEQLDVVQQFDGCGSSTLFEALFPCDHKLIAFLMRYIAPDPTLQAAEAALAQNDPAASHKLFQAYLAQHPGNLGARFKDGQVAYQLKDWSGSEQTFADLEKYFPNDPSILYNRALAMVELKQYGPAIARLNRVAQMNPRDRAAQMTLYRAYLLNGNQQQAAAVLEGIKRTIAANNPAAPPPAGPDSPEKMLDDLAAAEEHAKLAPTPENFLALSVVLDRNKKYRESIAACRKALQLRPDFPEAYNNIAAAYEALGMWDEAIQAAQQAIKLKPDFQLAKNNLAWSLSQKKLHQGDPPKAR